MKALFLGVERGWRFTEAGVELSDEFRQAIEPIFQRAIAAGYSPRDISHVAADEVRAVEAVMALRTSMDYRKNQNISAP